MGDRILGSAKRGATGPDYGKISEFVANLDIFAAQLDKREILALRLIIFSAMDPIERMRWKETALLKGNESRVLKSLLSSE
jgi:hypothetical protein